MAAASKKTSQRRTSYCRSCGEEFLTYKIGSTHCPRCGRRVQGWLQRRLVTVAVLVLLGGLAVAGVLLWWHFR